MSLSISGVSGPSIVAHEAVGGGLLGTAFADSGTSAAVRKKWSALGRRHSVMVATPKREAQVPKPPVARHPALVGP